MVKEFGVKVVWDDVAEEWIAVALGMPGLVAQADTLEGLFLKLSGNVLRLESGPDHESRDWLEADLSRMNEYEPYDWGEQGEPQGRPIRWNPQQQAFEVVGGKR